MSQVLATSPPILNAESGQALGKALDGSASLSRQELANLLREAAQRYVYASEEAAQGLMHAAELVDQRPESIFSIDDRMLLSNMFRNQARSLRAAGDYNRSIGLDVAAGKVLPV